MKKSATIMLFFLATLSIHINASNYSDRFSFYKFKQSDIGQLSSIKKINKKLKKLKKVQTKKVNCDTNNLALQKTIDNAPAIGLDILVTGTCSPITITKDNISINGQSSATIQQDGSSLITLTLLDASNIVLKNIILDNANTLGGINLFTEKSNITFDNISKIGQGAAIFLSGSNITVENKFESDSIVINALNSTFDSKASASVSIFGYVGTTNATLFNSNTFDVSTFFVLNQGSRADLDTGSLNLTGSLTLSNNASLSISNGVITGPVSLDGNSSLSINNDNLLNDDLPISLTTNSVLYWNAEEIPPAVNCGIGAIAVTSPFSSDNLCDN